MKTLILTTLLTTLLSAIQTIEIVCDRSYPPYSFKNQETKKASGVYVDVIKEAFNRMPNYQVKFKPLPWKRVIALVKNGKKIAFFPPYYNDERAVWLDFSIPILPETVVVFAKEITHKNKKKFPDDFKGLTVCLNRGFAPINLGGEKFIKMIESGELKLIEGINNKYCLRSISLGRADFYLNDQLIDIKAFPDIKRGLASKINNGHLAFTLRNDRYPNIQNIKKEFDKAILKLQNDKIIEKILNSYKQGMKY